MQVASSEQTYKMCYRPSYLPRAPCLSTSWGLPCSWSYWPPLAGARPPLWRPLASLPRPGPPLLLPLSSLPLLLPPITLSRPSQPTKPSLTIRQTDGSSNAIVLCSEQSPTLECYARRRCVTRHAREASQAMLGLMLPIQHVSTQRHAHTIFEVCSTKMWLSSN